MAEVEIRYDGSPIATMDESGTKTLLTAGKYCPASFQVEYNRPSTPAPAADAPVCTVTWTADWNQPTGISWNMTDAEITAWVNNSVSDNPVIDTIHSNGSVTEHKPALCLPQVLEGGTWFTVYDDQIPWMDVSRYGDVNSWHFPSTYELAAADSTLEANDTYYLYKFVGTLTVNVPMPSSDVPVFTVACSGSDWAPQNATCNMTLAEVRAWINQNSPDNLAGIYAIERNGNNTRIRPVLFMRDVSVPEFTVYYSLGFPAYDLDYQTNSVYVRQISAFRHEELTITRNGIQPVNAYIDSLSIETEHIIGLEKDANDNYVFTESFADITDAYTMGQELLVATNELTDVYVETVNYMESSDPDTHPEEASLVVSILESASNIVQIPTPDGTMSVENMHYTYRNITLSYDDTIDDTVTSDFYMVDGLASGTEAQPSDVTAGRVFINSNGIQVGTGIFVTDVWVDRTQGYPVAYLNDLVDDIVAAHQAGAIILAHVLNTSEYYPASVGFHNDEWVFSTVIEDLTFAPELSNHYIGVGLRKTYIDTSSQYNVAEERVYWYTDDIPSSDEAQPANVAAGKVFFNTTGPHLGTAT